VETVRFRRDRPGMLIVRGKNVLSWNPSDGSRQPLARNDDPLAKIVDADVFRGGVVVWLSRSDPDDPVRRSY
jgi:hypothetical protein